MVGIIRRRAVDSFEGRTGAVVAVAGDYSASEVTNDSGVAGDNVDDALDALAGDIPTTEEIQDLVGAMVSSNTETNISVTYNDTTGKLDFAVPAASDTVAGVIERATAAEMETATDTTRAVVPGRVHNHPGVAKFWAVVYLGGGGVPSLQSSYNVTSITDTDVGILDITIATDFSSPNWCPTVMAMQSGVIVNAYVNNIAAGTIQLACANGNGSAIVDPAAWFVAGFGDQ